MILKEWVTKFLDDEEVLFNMFNYYVFFLKTKEVSLRRMNEAATENIYFYKSKFDYDNLIVTFTLETKPKND